ncbi:MAG: hypothetical protein RLZZ63_304 [Gemmatimonadota bacterium]|jgi:hypothetical protein
MKLDTLLRGSLEALVIASVTFPVAMLNKVLFAVVLVIATVVAVRRSRRLAFETIAPLIVAFVFLYGATIGVGGDIDHTLARQLLFSVALLFLIYPIRWASTDFDGIIRRAGMWLTFFSFVYWAALGLSPFSASALTLFEWMTDASLAAAGTRDFLGFPIFMVHLGTSPFLLVSFALVLVRDRDRPPRVPLAALTMFVAILMSTSRALILLAIVLAGVIVPERYPPRVRVALTVIAAALGAGGLAWLADTTAIFSATDVSNAIKIGHAESFLSTRSWEGLLLGDGLAAMHFTTGLGLRVPQTEITLFDLVRYVGLLFAPLVFLALVCPVLDPRRYIASATGRLAVLVFTAYLFLAMTNPVLFNSAGLTVVLWYWSRILQPPAGAANRNVFA